MNWSGGDVRHPWVLLLSGPSGAGKSTLARGLLEICDVKAVHLEADRAFPTLNGDDVPRAIRAFHASVGAWCDSGFSVILDGSLPYGDEGLRSQCLDALHPHPTVIVGVNASSDALRARARRRGDSDPGWGASQQAAINRGLPLAASVDTTRRTTSDLATELCLALGWRRDS